MKKITIILIVVLTQSILFGQNTKKVLVEEFSSTACGVCPPRTKQLIDWDVQSPNRILVVHHSPTNDNMTNQTPALNLSSDYTINFQPAVIMNRKKFANCTTIHVPVNTAFFDSLAIEEVQQALATVSFSDVAYNDATREITGTINIQFLANVTGNYRVGLYIVENHVTGETGSPTMQGGNPNATTFTGVKAYDQKCYDANWAATNYAGYPYTDGCIVGYPHYNVVRHAVFGTYGDASTIPANPVAGSQYSKTFSYTIPTHYDPTVRGHAVILENIKLLAFVAQYSTDKFSRNILNCEIINLFTTPAQPSAISGPAAPCQNSTGLTYSVNNVAGTTYTWTLPNGWIQTSGGTTNAITVTAGTNAGTIIVTPSNSYGNGISRTLSVTTSTMPTQPSIISGNLNPCENTIGHTYSVSNVPNVIYNWLVPTGWTITTGQNTNSITVTAGSATGNITVTPGNSCGNGPARTLIVTTNSVPSQPSAINGPVSVNAGATGMVYSVSNVAGVNYTWSVPTGWNITAGQNTNSVIVTAGSASGNITVTPNNTCGNGNAQYLYVSIGTPPPAFAVQFNYNGQNINANDTISIIQPCTTSLIQIPISVTNTTTADAYIKVKRVSNTLLNHTANYFSWTNVYDTSVNISPDSLLIQAGQTSNNFVSYYLPKNQIGQTIVSYQFFRIDNPNVFHQITIKYVTTPVVTELPLTLTYNNQVIAQNGIITVSDTSNFMEMEALVTIENTGVNPVMVKVRKIENSILSGTQNYFCWGACYGYAIFESLDSILIEPGALCYDFSSHYEPHNKVGETSITYQFFQSVSPQIYKSCEIKFVTTVGIEDNSLNNNDLKVYPTIATDNINVISKQNIQEIKIYSSLGQQVIALKPNEDAVKINIQHLSAGIYYVHISTLAKAFIQKIIIPHN